MDTSKIEETLLNILNGIEKIESPAPDYSQDEIDSAQDLQERENILNWMSRNSNLKKEVTIALDKIKKGTYGICEISGEAIDPERLAFIPWARYTTKAQSEVEKTFSVKRSFEYLAEETEDGDIEVEEN
jgi:RNA polymerase-binding transcription factor DksA